MAISSWLSVHGVPQLTGHPLVANCHNIVASRCCKARLEGQSKPQEGDDLPAGKVCAGCWEFVHVSVGPNVTVWGGVPRMPGGMCAVVTKFVGAVCA